MNRLPSWLLGLVVFAAPDVASAAICPSPALRVAPDSRYEVIEPVAGEVIVRDLENGLEWQQCPQGRSGPNCTGTETRVDWSTALELANDSIHGGHDDWRLPNAQELYSLIEWGCTLPALNESRFPGESGGRLYWSSSSEDFNPNLVQVLDTGRGDSGNPQPKHESWSVRLVRGGDVWSRFNAAAMPDPFAFAEQLNVPVAEFRQSETFTISGLNAPTQVHVIGDSEAAYSHNGGAFGSAPQLAVNGDQIQVQHRSAATRSTTVATTLFVGGLSAEFRSTTIPGQRVGGSVTGLLGSGLVLQLNGSEDLPIVNDGSFQFGAELMSDESYAVTVIAQPSMPVQACSVANGSGIVSDSDISNVLVSCETVRFSVGGSVSGLLGSGLLLQNNGGDDLSIGADGPFSFATSLDDLSAYSVAVVAQPQLPRQTCLVDQGSGALAGGPVNSVQVSCTTDDVVVTPSSGAGGSIAPAAPQTLPYQASQSFTLSPDPNHQLFAVNGSCGGSLDGNVYTTAPVLADCSVQAQFRPLTSTGLIAPSTPVRAGESVLLTADVTGLAGGPPQGGSVSISLSSGEQCSDAGPPSLNGDTARFSCALTPTTLGNQQAQASYTKSASHIESASASALLAVRRFADLSAELDDGELESVPGATASYLLMIRNGGPDAAPASAVLLAAEPPLLDAQWSCTAVGSASCPATNGSGELSVLVEVPAGGGLDLVQSGQIPAQLPTSVVVVQAQVSASESDPDWVFDPTASNDIATDINLVEGIFADGFE